MSNPIYTGWISPEERATARLEARIEALEEANLLLSLKERELEKMLADTQDDLNDEREAYRGVREDCIAWEDTANSEHERASKLEERVDELEEELAAYRVIEDKTGMSPERIIEVMSDLKHAFALAKCPVCKANEDSSGS